MPIAVAYNAVRAIFEVNREGLFLTKWVSKTIELVKFKFGTTGYISHAASTRQNCWTLEKGRGVEHEKVIKHAFFRFSQPTTSSVASSSPSSSIING